MAALKTETITVRIEPAVKAGLKAVAEQERRSLVNMIDVILAKLYRIANAELNRYLNAEKRALIALVEQLWDKYALSSRQLEASRADTLATLDGFLERLGYLEAPQ